MRTLTSFVLALAILVTSGSAGRAGSDPDEQAIRQRLETWRQAFNTRNAAGACDLFAADLSYSVPGIIEGDHQTMCGNFRRLFSKPGLTLHYDEPFIYEMRIEDSIAIVRLRWTLTTEVDGTREVTTEEGMDIFARQPDGRWSISRFVAF